nr:E3 ubiquitin-protein ligase RNF168 [Oryctolagus cuniculus]
MSSWARRHAAKNSLVNLELWQLIQKRYPMECRLRESGQELAEIINDRHPVHLSEPGELRREYEEEKSKMEAQCQFTQEEENKANEDYVQRQLAEEEKQRRQAGRKQNQPKQRPKREAPRTKPNGNTTSTCGTSSTTSPPQSAEPEPVPTTSPRKCKGKKRNIGDTQACLSPTSQSGSTSQAASVQEIKNPTWKKSDRSNENNPAWQDTDFEKDMPTRPPRITDEIAEQAATSSAGPSLLWNHPYHTRICVEGRITMRPNNPGRDGLQTKVPSLGEPAASVSRITHITGNNTVKKENKESSCTARKAVAKRKNQEPPFKDVKDSCFSAKRRQLSSSSSSAQDEAEYLEGLITTECLLAQRHKQEEQDWLLASKLQEEENRRAMKPNRQKGSLDEYQLCAASSLANAQRENPKAGTSKVKAFESQKGSTDDN